MNLMKKSLIGTVEKLDDFQRRGCLADVAFTAKPFSVTGLIGPDKYELRTIVQLISSMRDSGIFDGEAYVSGQPAENSLLPAADVVFVAEVSLHTSMDSINKAY